MIPTARSLKLSSARLSSLIGLAVALIGAPSFGQAPAPSPTGAAKIVINPEGMVSDRFAVPGCIPRTGDEAAREACKTITAVLKDDLRFEAVPIVSEKLYDALPEQKPDAPNFGDWEGDRCAGSRNDESGRHGRKGPG